MLWNCFQAADAQSTSVSVLLNTFLFIRITAKTHVMIDKRIAAIACEGYMVFIKVCDKNSESTNTPQIAATSGTDTHG